ncbi:MAG: hypothetical protein M3430_04070 [Acidobacteriota bacterium]|nr:hypothetical protein [Acidobacteriota bacterium]
MRIKSFNSMRLQSFREKVERSAAVRLRALASTNIYQNPQQRANENTAAEGRTKNEIHT